eukprot:696368-Pyramimonas_sp.AAC.1
MRTRSECCRAECRMPPAAPMPIRAEARWWRRGPERCGPGGGVASTGVRQGLLAPVAGPMPMTCHDDDPALAALAGPSPRGKGGPLRKKEGGGGEGTHAPRDK